MAMHYAAENAKGSALMTWLVERKARADIRDSLVRTPHHPPPPPHIILATIEVSFKKIYIWPNFSS
jgi:hypothetical protein